MNSITLPSEMTSKIDQLCALAPVIPVLTIEKVSDAVPLAEALVEGGLPVLEVTLRTEAALDAIAAIAKSVPNAEVGAGTILNPSDYQRAVDNGASFIVSPGITTELLEFGTTHTTPYLPGIQTVSEMMEGIRLGYKRFKFFPAELAGGTGTLKALSGPFAEIKFCPTGGIRSHTASSFLELDNVMCVGGTWLTPADLVAAQDWVAIAGLARNTLNRINETT